MDERVEESFISGLFGVRQNPACTDDRDALCALPVIQRQKGDISGCGILSVQPKTSPSHPTILHSRGRAVGSSAQARPSQPLLNRNCRSGKPSRKGCVARRPLKPRRYLDRVLCDLTYRCAVFRTKVCLRAIQPFRRTFLPGSPALVTVPVLHRCDIIHLLKDAVKMFYILISHRFRDALHRGAAAL